jgi:hypothetical protein
LNTVLEDVVNKSTKLDKTSTAYSAVELIEHEIVEKLHLQLVALGDVFGTISSGKEAKRLHFIAVILVAVAQLFKTDGEKVTILVEEDVNGCNIKTNGHFEFVLQKGNKRVCIVEAKKKKKWRKAWHRVFWDAKPSRILRMYLLCMLWSQTSSSGTS